MPVLPPTAPRPTILGAFIFPMAKAPSSGALIWLQGGPGLPVGGLLGD